MPYRDRIAERDRIVTEIGATWRALVALETDTTSGNEGRYSQRAKPLEDRLQRLRARLDWISRGAEVPECTPPPECALEPEAN